MCVSRYCVCDFVLMVNVQCTNSKCSANGALGDSSVASIYLDFYHIC